MAKEAFISLSRDDRARRWSSCSFFKHQIAVFSLTKVAELLWPGNSSDLNAIEPCWWYMKVKTTRKGESTSRKELEKQWLDCWGKLEQERIDTR